MPGGRRHSDTEVSPLIVAVLGCTVIILLTAGGSIALTLWAWTFGGPIGFVLRSNGNLHFYFCLNRTLSISTRLSDESSGTID